MTMNRTNPDNHHDASLPPPQQETTTTTSSKERQQRRVCLCVAITLVVMVISIGLIVSLYVNQVFDKDDHGQTKSHGSGGPIIRDAEQQNETDRPDNNNNNSPFVWQRQGQVMASPPEANQNVHHGWGRTVALDAKGQTVVAATTNDWIVAWTWDDSITNNKNWTIARQQDVSYYTYNNNAYDNSNDHDNDYTRAIAVSDNGQWIAMGTRYDMFVFSLTNQADFWIWWAKQGFWIYPPQPPPLLKTVALSSGMTGQTVLAIGGIPVSTNNAEDFTTSGRIQVRRHVPEEKSWTEFQHDKLNDNNQEELPFGTTVALSQDGNILATGDPEQYDGLLIHPGTVRVFRYNSISQQWQRMGQTLQGSPSRDGFGHFVALSSNGRTLACGIDVQVSSFSSNSMDRRENHVRVFTFLSETNTWVPKGQDLVLMSTTTSGTPTNAVWSMAMSRNGNVLAMGDPHDNAQTGRVRIYRYNSKMDAWEQVGQDLTGLWQGAQFGYAVALSEKGDVVAVGSSSASGNTGDIQVFKLEENSQRF